MPHDFFAPLSAHCHRKTKVVATVGPASCSPERVRQLVLAGVDVFRLNFSHGSHEIHTTSLKTIRAISSELRTPVAVLQDLSGPKIRISPIEGDFAMLPDRADVELAFADGSKTTIDRIMVEGINPVDVLRPGQQVLMADGIIELRAVEVTGKTVRCTVVKGGRLRSKVGIAFPESSVSLPATTEKDFHDLEWGIAHEVDYVAISFVQDAEDITRLRDVIKKRGADVPIIAKIERRVALQNIEEILAVADSIMVARGDLGLELPIEQLPGVQKQLIELANNRGIPVIVATQMLTSMVTAVRPTRAEVSDVATAVMSGADAVMLSEETTIGENPVECVKYLSRIAFEAERTFAFEEYKLRLRNSDQATVPDAVSYAACAAAVKINAAAIIGCSETGNSVRLIAKYRPTQPLYGVSARESTLRRMCLYWGVRPISATPTDTHLNEISEALSLVQKLEALPNGSRAIITGGLSVRTPGATSIMEIREFIYQ